MNSLPPYNPNEEGTNWKFQVKVEKWRCIAYSFFWTMCGFAALMTKMYVVPNLAEGPKSSVPIEQQGCGPFNRPSIGYGKGFDYSTENHLIDAFGYGNICTSWDYSPSRELTAMYFPFFEYSLVVHLVLDCAKDKLLYRRGELPEWFFKLSNIISVLSIYLCINFRMTFVCISYESIKQHTAGFLGLQIALILVAVQNTMHVIILGESYPYLNLSTVQTTRLAKTYLVLNCLISSVKIWATTYIINHGVGPDLYKAQSGIGDLVWGRIIDIIWMIFNAILPFFISFVRMQDEAPIEFEISLPATPTHNVNKLSSGEYGKATRETTPLNLGTA